MNRLFPTAALLMFAIASSADAAIAIGVTGPGTLNSTVEAVVSYPDVSFSGDGTITDWSIFGTDPVLKTVAYHTSDLDFTSAFGAGFRWSETVTNTSSFSWTDFHIKLVDTSSTFSGSGDFLTVGAGTKEVPDFATITAGPTVTLLPTLVNPLPSGWVMSLSADQKEITIDFGATPLAPGASFSVHTPIEQLGVGPEATTWSFVLSEQVSVPEPSAMVVWSLLAAVGLTIAGRRRR